MRATVNASPRATRTYAAAATSPPTHAPRNGGDGEDLSANWKSALCVTSLYDSYVQLQQENDALKGHVHELQLQQNELLDAHHSTRKQQLSSSASPRKGGERPEHDGDHSDSEEEDDEDSIRYAQLRREIQLLRAEKEQLELLHSQYRKQAESQQQESKTQYNDLAEKYQVRYALDPNGAKRVALAVQTLQETLEKVVHEKEELGLRYTKLHQLYNRLQQEQSQSLQLLQAQVQQFEHKRTEGAKKTVVGVVHKWYAGQLTFAWQQWTANVALKRRQATEQSEREVLQTHIKAKAKLQRDRKATRILIKCLQNASRRTFVAWKHVTQHTRDTRVQITTFRRQSALSTAKKCFTTWKRASRHRSSHRSGLKRLSRVFKMRKERLAWRKWTTEVFANQRVFSLQQQHTTLSDQLVVLMTELQATKTQLATAEWNNEQLAAQHDLERLKLETKVYEKHSTETKLLKRVGSFFTRQNNRQLLQSTLSEWKARVANINAVRKRTKWVHDSLQASKLRRSVVRWHVTIRKQCRYKHVVTQFLSRMRHVGVLQALNAWKAYKSGKKEREAVARKVVHRLAHKHLVSCFEQWRDFKTQQREVKTALGALCTSIERLKLSGSFATWKQLSCTIAAAEATSQQQDLQRDWELRLEQAKMDTMLIRRCFQHWRLKVHKVRVCKRLALRTLSRWRNGLLARVFIDWQCFRFEQQRQRELITRWLRRSRVAALQSAWLKWHNKLTLKTQQELLARVHEQHCHDIALLKNEIAQLHCTHHNLVASRAESTRNLELQLAIAQREAQLEAQRQEKYANALMKLARQKERLELTLQRFRHWRNQVTTAKINRQRVLRFVHNSETQRLATVFHQWNQLRKQRVLLTRAATLLRSFMDQCRTIQSFSAWHERIQSTRSVRHFYASFQQRAIERQCRAVLHQWHTAARAHFLIRRTSERIWLFSVHLRVKDFYSKWKAISDHERFMETNAKRKELLLSIQSRVFSKWTSCSLKVVFHAWTRTMKRAQCGKRAETKLVLMHKTHLVSSSFQQLRLNAALKFEQRLWMRKWCEKRAVNAQTRAFMLWKVVYARLQRHEIDALRTIRAQQDAELLSSREEATLLAQASLENEAKLERALSLVADSERAIQRHWSATLLKEHFEAWKLHITQTRCHEKVAERFAITASKQKLLTSFTAWKRTWSATKSRRMAAETRRSRRAQTLLTKGFFTWSQRVRDQLWLKRRLTAVTRRRSLWIMRDTLREWCSQVHLRANLSVAVPRLNEIARRLQLHNGFTQLKLLAAAKKTREAMQVEKQRRIMAFIMDRHCWNLERVFRSWHAFAAAKRVKYADARQRFDRKCTQLKQFVFKDWTVHSSRLKTQRRLLRAMHKHFVVHHLRAALSKWRNQIHEHVVNALQESNAVQAQRLELVNYELTAKDALVHRAQDTVIACDEQIVRLEDLLSSASTTAAQLHHQHQEDLSRARALLKLALQRTVSRQVLMAFTRWKAQNAALCDMDDALQRLERMMRRKQRTLSFKIWKSKAQRASRLKSVQQRTTKSSLQTVVDNWKSFCKRQLRIKVLLVRLCVTAALQREQSTLTVCGAFQLLLKHGAIVQTTRELRLLKDTVNRDARAMNTSRKQLLLAKWSWRAYSIRLQDLHRFFSQCRGVASKQQRKQHTSTLQELSIVNHDLTANLEKLNKEIQLADQERSKASELTIDERSVVNSSLPGLQTLFRQLAQVSSTHDLFGKVAGTFPQILHGSAGTSWSIDVILLAH